MGERAKESHHDVYFLSFPHSLTPTFHLSRRPGSIHHTLHTQTVTNGTNIERHAIEIRLSRRFPSFSGRFVSSFDETLLIRPTFSSPFNVLYTSIILDKRSTTLSLCRLCELFQRFISYKYSRTHTQTRTLEYTLRILSIYTSPLTHTRMPSHLYRINNELK